MVQWDMKTLTRILFPLLFPVLALLAGCGGEDLTKPPGEYKKFYRIKIEVTHDKTEPVVLDYILGCRTSTRNYVGESSTGYYAVPIMYGVATKGGQGIMTHAPKICGSDIKKNVPDDFMPAMFHAEKAGDMSFFTAYLSEMAYAQKASRLTFHKATVTEVSRGDYDRWLKQGVPNIVPQVDGPWWWEVFNNDYWNWDDRRFDRDPRNNPRRLGNIGCASLTKEKIPVKLLEEVRRQWPASRPQYWVISEPRDVISGLLFADGEGQSMEAFNWGIRRPSGWGSLHDFDFLKIDPASYGPRIPYYRTDFYPDPIPKEPIEKIELHVNTKDGLDQGFAYCYRGWNSRLEGQFGKLVDFKFAPDGKYRIIKDGVLLAEFPFPPLRGEGEPTQRLQQGFILERDEFVLSYTGFGFENENAGMR